MLAELLVRAPRARDHAVTKAVGDWKLRFPEEYRSVIARYDEGPRTRPDVAELLRDIDPVARTVVVQLWGGARGDNMAAPVREQPRATVAVVRGKPYDGEDNHADAHRFLWDTAHAWQPEFDGPPLLPFVAFDKLWKPDQRSRGLLPGIGCAFGTKILYWAERIVHGFDHTPASPMPLIFDARVLATLAGLGVTYTTGADGEGAPTRFTRTTDGGAMPYHCYAAYCQLAWRWAAICNDALPSEAPFVPDDVELWLFRATDSPSERGTASSAPGLAGGPEPESQGGPETEIGFSEADWNPEFLRQLVEQLATIEGVVALELPASLEQSEHFR